MRQLGKSEDCTCPLKQAAVGAHLQMVMKKWIPRVSHPSPPVCLSLSFPAPQLNTTKFGSCSCSASAGDSPLQSHFFEHLQQNSILSSASMVLQPRAEGPLAGYQFLKLGARNVSCLHPCLMSTSMSCSKASPVAMPKLKWDGKV
jgi:hypothetical protein